MSYTHRFDKIFVDVEDWEKVFLEVVSEKEAGSVVEPGSRPVPVILH